MSTMDFEESGSCCVCCWAVAAALVAAVVFVIKKKLSLPKRVVETALTNGTPGSKVTLFGLPTTGDILFSVSSPCAKAAAFLQLSGLDFEYKLTSPMNAPKGKLPYIVHGDDVVADSSFIIRYLVNTYTSDNDTMLGKLLVKLTPEQNAVGTAVKVMCENDIYNFLIYYRWLTPVSSQFLKEGFLKKLPWGVRHLMLRIIQLSMDSWLFGQGFIRHHEKDMLHLVLEDFKSIEAFIGTKDFLVADEPTIHDCALFATLDNSFTFGPKELEDFIASSNVLNSYHARMKKLLTEKELNMASNNNC
eukprot:m.240849 g.240849  ORF g.240849 m.240849 type:complete len:303 (+) comp16202_c0_seq1:32-940(+)